MTTPPIYIPSDATSVGVAFTLDGNFSAVVTADPSFPARLTQAIADAADVDVSRVTLTSLTEGRR